MKPDQTETPSSGLIPRSFKEAFAVAAIVALWAVIVACLVVLDRHNYAWMAVLVYVALYIAIARVESQSRKRK